MTYQELVDRSVAERGHPRKYGVDKIKGYNQHHIIPKSMGGTNDGNNIVYFTYAEHLMAHILLFRENPNNYGLAKTATFMADKCDVIRDYLVTIVDNEDEFNDYIVDLVKAREVANEEHSKHISGKNNPFYGKHHTEESRQKMRENRPDVSGENNPTSKSVRCKETGQVFATCRMASKWAKCSPGNITHALKTGGKAKGYHWEYITREEYLAIENE